MRDEERSGQRARSQASFGSGPSTVSESGLFERAERNYRRFRERLASQPTETIVVAWYRDEDWTAWDLLVAFGRVVVDDLEPTRTERNRLGLNWCESIPPTEAGSSKERMNWT